MRRILLCVFAVLLPCSLLYGCASEPSVQYPVYFASRDVKEQAALQSEPRTLAQGEDPVGGLLRILLAGPAGESLTRTIPEEVTLRGWTLQNGTLTVDFSGQYDALSGIDLTLADYSVVLTMSQLPDVETVVITVDGETVPYRDHQSLLPKEALLDVFQQASP